MPPYCLEWVFTDWLPEELFANKVLLNSFINIVPRAYGEYARLATIPETGKEQIIIEKPQGYQNLNFGENHLFTAQERLAIMNEAGVAKAILRIPCWHNLGDQRRQLRPKSTGASGQTHFQSRG